MLLPGASGRARQRGGACRQAERAGYRGIFLFCVWGEAEQKSGRRPCASDSGNRSYGAAVRKSLRIVAGGLTIHLEKKIQGIVKRLRPLSAK